MNTGGSDVALRHYKRTPNSQTSIRKPASEVSARARDRSGSGPRDPSDGRVTVAVRRACAGDAEEQEEGPPRKEEEERVRRGVGLRAHACAGVRGAAGWTRASRPRRGRDARRVTKRAGRAREHRARCRFRSAASIRSPSHHHRVDSPSGGVPAPPSSRLATIPSSHHPIIPSSHHPVLPPSHHPTIPSPHHPIIPSSHHPVLPPSSVSHQQVTRGSVDRSSREKREKRT